MGEVPLYGFPGGGGVFLQERYPCIGAHRFGKPGLFPVPKLAGGEREIFIDNLLVRVHWITEMIVVQRPCAMGV